MLESCAFCVLSATNFFSIRARKTSASCRRNTESMVKVYLLMRWAFSILSSIAFLFTDTLSLRYFSISRLAIGAAHVAPYPAFSMATAMAILGFSLGAKATNIEWSGILITVPFTMALFSAVPVLAHMVTPSSLAPAAVPLSTTSCMACCTILKVLSGIFSTRCISLYFFSSVSLVLSPIDFTKCGV